MNPSASFIKFSLSALALIAASHTHADTLLGIYAGAGTWQSEYAGDIGKPSTSAADLGIEDSDNNFYYIALEHPIPLIPNIKVQQTNITNQQSSVLEKTFSIGNINYSTGTEIATDFDLSYTDATLYYELLDNWVTLDLGVTLRKYSGYLEAKSVNSREKTDIDVQVPLAYGHAQFELPFTGFFAGLEGNYISYDGNDLADYSAKIGYSFDSVLDVGVEVGYRALTVNIDDGDVQTNLDIKGPYAAAIFHF
jgi:outer membrane protein